MKRETTPFIEKCRVKTGAFATRRDDGFNGAFFVPYDRDPRIVLKVIASDGEGWEHVSVSLPTRCPTWSEMCFIKEVFWEDEECVMQLHPPRSAYVNNMRFCLHLWKPTRAEIPRPPAEFVGVQSLGSIR